MKREKIFKKACKGSGIQIINNTYIDRNDEIHTRNQWVNLGGAAYVIDFPRTLAENEILYLAGVPSEKFCEGYVKFFDSTEMKLDLSDNNPADVHLDRCNFTINGELTLFKTSDNDPTTDEALFINAENLALIDDEKELMYVLRYDSNGLPCVIAKNGLFAIAMFLPFKFEDASTKASSPLADNALTAYRIISGRGQYAI